MTRLSSLALARPVCSRHRSTISCRPMATTAFFLSVRLVPPQDFLPFLHRWVLGLELDDPPDHLGNNAANGRHSHFGDRAPPLVLSGTPLTGYHPGQASDLATTRIKVPIEHLASELHEAVGSRPFGPRTAVTLCQSRF